MAQGPDEPTTEEIRNWLAALDTSDLDDAAKEQVKKNFGQAIAQSEAAAGFGKQVAALKKTIAEGPAETTALRQQLEQRKSGKDADAPDRKAPPANATPEMIDTRLASERTRLAELSRQIDEREKELAALETRPETNRARFVEISRLLAEAEALATRSKAAPRETLQEKAVFALDQTRVRMLRAELAMLEQESLSFDIRRALLQAQRDLVASSQAQAREMITALESRSGEIVNARIAESEALIGGLELQSVADDDRVKALFEETRRLAEANQATLGKIAVAEAERDRIEAELERLRRESENIRAQIEIGGLEGSFSEIMLDLRRTLPTPQSLRTATNERRKAVSTARLDAFQANAWLSSQPSVEGQVEELLDLLRTKGTEEKELTKLRPSLQEFMANRVRLRQDAVDANRRLSTVLGETDQIVGQILNVAESLRDYLGERLVWVASSPPLGPNAFDGMRAALTGLAGRASLSDYARAISRIDLFRWVIFGCLVVILAVPRRKLRAKLAESSLQTRRISKDHIGNTLSAMLVSLWLALPFPALLTFFGIVFTTDPTASNAVYALGKGLLAPAPLLLMLRFTSVLCWPGGVAESHFGWRRPYLDAVRRALLALVFLYLPAHLVLTVWWHDSADLAAFQGPGRLVFIVAMSVVALVLRKFLCSVHRQMETDHPSPSRFARWRQTLSSLLVVLPVALAILAALGHFLTAVAVANLVQDTALVLLGSGLLSAVLVRWAALRGRRIALADALAQREARRTAQEVADNGDDERPTAAEEFGETPEEEETLGLAEIGEQTRHFIRAIVTLIAIFGCWMVWADLMPALKYFDSHNLFGEVSISDLVRTGLIAAITWIAFQNLPGLLELGFLRALNLEAGVRNAVVTLGQYIVVAVGTTLVSDAIGLDWSRFGWIAAALSVGLGFGLQEVVANFVSGLILLFERPIRVGDIVTVGGVDGTVTRIRIRATTITTGDRKEFIVPNKTFITGTIMNWTLSSPITRLVVPVGITYGSDVKKATGILLDIARSQPEVLADPVPAAAFEQFGASTLNLSLRCFVARPDQRSELTHRLHMLINERFAAAGIEMVSPYQEVHVKSLDAPGE